MEIGIGDTDSRRMILLKLCILIPLMPFTLLVGVFWVGIPEVWDAVKRFPREVRNVYAWYERARW